MSHIVIDARIRRASTGRYIDRLVEHLQQIDTQNRYTVLVQPDDPWQPSAPNFTRAGSHYPQFSLNPLHQLGFARQLYALKADLVNFPMNQQPLLYFKPVVTATMDLTMLRFTRPGGTPLPIFWFKMLAYKFLFWYSLRKSKAIITISKFVKKDVETHYPFTKGRITVTYCASEPSLPVKPEPLKGVREPFIMHVGSPFPHKNIECLVEVFGLLKEKRFPDLQLVLVGKREYYFDKLEKEIADNPYRKDIKIAGFVNDKELKWLYEQTDCYVLPSMSEGFGLPGLEAMVHGAPVASSSATCLPEIYGDAAQYFDPLDVADMADKISQVLDHPTLANELRVKGTKQAAKYSWKRMATQTLAIYNMVLGE